MENIILTPEQLFFLGECMHARYIDYDYIAAMHELQRNYQRSRRRYISELVQSGLVRERLSGEITVKPLPEKLLRNVFFGQTETTLQVIEPDSEEAPPIWRFHWHEGDATQVRTVNSSLEVSSCTGETVEALVSRLINTADDPQPISALCQQRIQKILVAKKAVVGAGSNGLMLFEQDGSLYTTDEAGVPQCVSCRQGRELLLQVLKGE